MAVDRAVDTDAEETELERWQRNFAELLQELRVAQTGVQILFAFLLTLAFSGRFTDRDTFQQVVYLVALLSAAGAAALLIAPVAHHRMLFRRGRKPDVVRAAHRLAGRGLALLLVAMSASVLLATDLVLDRAAAITVSALTFAVFSYLWGLAPWLLRNRSEPEEDTGP